MVEKSRLNQRINAKAEVHQLKGVEDYLIFDIVDGNQAIKVERTLRQNSRLQPQFARYCNRR